MTNVQLRMLDKLLRLELEREDEKFLYKISMLYRELNSFENTQLLEVFDKYLSYGTE